MDGNINKKGGPMTGDFMERLFDARPKYRLKQHFIALGVVFGATMTCMYLMTNNIENTMPWRTSKNKEE